MDFVFWIILIVLIVGVVWWLLNRSSSSNTGDSTPIRTDGGLAGGSAAASAEAAGTAGIPGAAGFGASEPTPPTTADEAPDRSSTAESQEAGAGHKDGGEEASVEKDTSVGQHIIAEPDVAGSAVTAGAADTAGATDTAGPAETAAADAPERPSAEELLSPEPAGSGEPGRPEQPAGQEKPARPESLAAQEPGSTESVSRQADEAEWETQWSEASAPAPSAASHRPADEASTVIADTPMSEAPPAQGAGFVHHPEYTEPHAPTLPGAETAAAEAEAADTPEPTGHLAADQPYGAGSASPGPDGSGPADFEVKADAGAMVYYEEGHPDYEQTKADVWFESAAHAEAAGFRAPRRTRI
ncbi:sunset domain-containing protein [Pseudarthrobacter sp.]|uniref:sunset domain-containing protein n=1 Tax=Pseudarthrobacter sp. TaxID=1934409 RepID=UPI002FC89518